MLGRPSSNPPPPPPPPHRHPRLLTAPMSEQRYRRTHHPSHHAYAATPRQPREHGRHRHPPQPLPLPLALAARLPSSASAIQDSSTLTATLGWLTTSARAQLLAGRFGQAVLSIAVNPISLGAAARHPGHRKRQLRPLPQSKSPIHFSQLTTSTTMKTSRSLPPFKTNRHR